jgi:hypothetical protein
MAVWAYDSNSAKRSVQNVGEPPDSWNRDMAVHRSTRRRRDLSPQFSTSSVVHVASKEEKDGHDSWKASAILLQAKRWHLEAVNKAVI